MKLTKNIFARKNGIVLAKFENIYIDDGDNNYVTWSEDKNGNHYSGHYFIDLRQAVKDFYKRAGDD
jgi:hypothetical protein